MLAVCVRARYVCGVCCVRDCVCVCVCVCACVCVCVTVCTHRRISRELGSICGTPGTSSLCLASSARASSLVHSSGQIFRSNSLVNGQIYQAPAPSASPPPQGPPAWSTSLVTGQFLWSKKLCIKGASSLRPTQRERDTQRSLLRCSRS